MATTKKTATAKVAEAEAKTEAAATGKAAPKAEVKAEVKAEAAPAVKTATKTAAPKKTTAARTTTAAKKAETVKKADPVKKAPAKRTSTKKAEPKCTVVVEYMGNQIKAKDVLAAATKAYTEMNKGASIETMEVYIKPDEGAAYYVVNGVGCDDYKIML